MGYKLGQSIPYLRSNKVGGVTGCQQQPIVSSQLLGKAKVTDAYRIRIARIVHVENVAGL